MPLRAPARRRRARAPGAQSSASGMRSPPPAPGCRPAPRRAPQARRPAAPPASPRGMAARAGCAAGAAARPSAPARRARARRPRPGARERVTRAARRAPALRRCRPHAAYGSQVCSALLTTGAEPETAAPCGALSTRAAAAARPATAPRRQAGLRAGRNRHERARHGCKHGTGSLATSTYRHCPQTLYMLSGIRLQINGLPRADLP